MEGQLDFYQLADMFGQALDGTPEGRVLQHVAKRPRVRVKQSRIVWRPARVRVDDVNRGEGEEQ